MTFEKSDPPCFIGETEWAIAQGSRVVVIPKSQKKQFEPRYSLIPVSKTIFGLRFPYLPDLLKSKSLVGSNNTEKLVQIAQNQINLITEFRKWKVSSFSLRYFWNPEEKNVEIAILGSGICLKDDEKLFVSKMVSDLQQLFSGKGYFCQPITDINELNFFLNPFRKGYFFEVRQRENLLPMAKGKAYVVYPFGFSPTSTWINLFDTLSTQTAACLVNIHLEITSLTEAENIFFSSAAQLAANLSHENINGLAGRYEFSDPVAKTVAQIYNDYLQRFHDPFLVTAQVITPDPQTGRNVAQGIKTELNNAQLGENRKIQTGAQIFSPCDEGEYREAKQTLVNLDLALWGGDARSGQERLPYLTDVRTASALFRFPIAVQGKIPGILVKPPSPKERDMIQILFLAAEPTDTARLRLGEELREIREKLQLAKMRDKFDLQERMSVRPADITQALFDVQPEIIHFSGHGMANGALCFENQEGKSQPIQPEALAALFEQFAHQVDCVILNACYSETQAKAIVKHINYVVGMKQGIGDKAAIAFAIGFYQALGAGRTVEQAYKMGCVQIGLHGIPENLTPVLVQKNA